MIDDRIKLTFVDDLSPAAESAESIGALAERLEQETKVIDQEYHHSLLRRGDHGGH